MSIAIFQTPPMLLFVAALALNPLAALAAAASVVAVAVAVAVAAAPVAVAAVVPAVDAAVVLLSSLF
jgi:hypothetical protein